uniref:Calponin-homology (CH) domain-containing protein n=1 Tax=Astyanax mexicanus TaxID=7994 RepID=A0A8B9JIB7_ASTMX
MAASVLLSAESTVPAFAVGNPGAAGAAANGLSVPGPASWNRSLDRALEEAAATGSLNLSGRKLKEFPRSAANHDLTDTTRADLSRNRLSELPVEVCMFVSLENLNLYQNCLRSLPESLINLQALTYLNISRNQLSTLPAHVCSLPLKVLIACNNKLVSLPEELGQLRQLTELDVSCNEIQTLPSQVGQLETLRDLNIRRNHLVRLPPELAELPLVRLDFSCNKVTSIPVCYRNLRHLQSIVLDNNPLQSPPAQICIKGKIHIFKYLNMEACKIAPDLPDYDRRPLGFGSCVDELYPGRPYGALDSGFNSVDSGDKRWSGNEVSHRLSLLTYTILETELEQIDFIDSCTGEEDEEDGRSRGGEPVSLSSQFMAYIERRITREVPVLCINFLFSSFLVSSEKGSLYRIFFLFYLYSKWLSNQLTVTSNSSSFRNRHSPPLFMTQFVYLVALLQNIESRLKVSLPSDLGAALTDGVVLCHLANHVRPRSVPSIHVPSPAVPKLTMAKCRRNVENFLEACRRIGVPQGCLCSVADVLEGEALNLYRLLEALLSLAPPLRPSPPSQLAGFALFYLSVMSLLCVLYCHLVPRI